MRPFIRCLFFLILLAGLAACGKKGAKLQQSVVPPDKTLFETGQEYLEKSQFIKGRLAFQTLINTYPDSELAAESYLAIGDSFYDEGGTENLLQAEDQYKNFIIFFPTHPKAADAQMKIASGNIRMMRDPDRDQTYAIKAQDALLRFLQQFPDSEFVPAAKEQLKQVQEVLAESDAGVGRFYFDRGNYRAAKSRFKTIVEKYPEYSLMDEAHFRLAQSLEKTENTDEAGIYYGKIATGFPHSKHFDEAKARLKEMGKPVPAVDTVVADLNKSRVKPSEGFSPIKPFVDFIEALGFKGPPDPYLSAKKMVEEKRAEAAAAQSTASKEGEKAGDDILINTVIEKSATGETQSKTVLGSNSKETKPVTDKNGEKKKDSNRNNKKKSVKKPA